MNNNVFRKYQVIEVDFSMINVAFKVIHVEFSNTAFDLLIKLIFIVALDFVFFFLYLNVQYLIDFSMEIHV